MSEFAPDSTSMRGKGDLFQIVARRRRLFNEYLFGAAISDIEFLHLMALHRATFGMPLEERIPNELLARYRPSHILWRKLPIYPNCKPAPIPRGYGIKLKAISTVVYSDDACEVWKINYP